MDFSPSRRAWSLPVAFALGAACAADPGDPPKVGSDGGVRVVMPQVDAAYDDGGAGSSGTSSGSSNGVTSGSGGGSSNATSSSGSGSGSSNGSTASGSSSGSNGSASLSGSSGTSTGGTMEGGSAGPVGDAGACLQNIPSSCQCSMFVQNASDAPNCQKYVQCYVMNSCTPMSSCAQMDSVCGVNTIGGGTAPQTAAAMVYMCACP